MFFDDITPIRRARKSDPATSKQAAVNAGRFAESHASRILAELRKSVATAHRLSELTGLTVVQIDRRLPELERAGLARPVMVLGQQLVIGGYRVWEAV